MTNGVLHCLECANYGKRPSCEVCGRVKSKTRIALEKQYREEAYLRSLSGPERRALKDKARAAQQMLDRLKDEAGRADELNDFLHGLWMGLRKFQMDSCGHPPLDAKLKELFGVWL